MFEMGFKDEMLIDRIWNKGTIVEGYDPNLFRKDPAVCRQLRFLVRIQHPPHKADEGSQQEEGGKDKGASGIYLPLLRQSYPDYIAVVQSDDNHNIDMNSARLVRKELQNKLAELYNIK